MNPSSSATRLRLLDLDPGSVLPAAATLAEAALLLADTASPVLALRQGAGGASRHAVVLERDVRLACQDGDPEQPARVVARDGLVAADEAAGKVLLAADAALPGVLVDGGGGEPLRVLARATTPVTTAVVMAGGLGKRLRPLTETLPKPLLDVRGQPLLFRILRHLHRHGVRRVLLSVHYLAHLVRERVGDGRAFDLSVEYLQEDRPLDTGAGLVLMPRIDEPFVVMNGDLLTTVNLAAMARQHALDGSLATVGTYLFPATLPYGLVQRDGARIVHVEEKPVLRYPINAGIYVFSPRVLDLVPRGAPLPMVPFLNERIDAGERVQRFPIVEYWNDVGARPDYERAQREAEQQDEQQAARQDAASGAAAPADPASRASGAPGTSRDSGAPSASGASNAAATSSAPGASGAPGVQGTPGKSSASGVALPPDSAGGRGR